MYTGIFKSRHVLEQYPKIKLRVRQSVRWLEHIPCLEVFKNFCFKHFKELLMIYCRLTSTCFNPLTNNVPHHVETSQLVCNTNQLTGFHMMADGGTLVVNELTHHFCSRLLQEIFFWKLQAVGLNLNKNEPLHTNFKGFFPDFKNTNFSEHHLNGCLCSGFTFRLECICQPCKSM